MNTEDLDQETQGTDTPEQSNDKVTKKYNVTLAIIASVVGGAANLKPVSKVDGDTTAKIVAELFHEEQEKLEADTKEGLKALLKKHVEAESEIGRKEKELKDLQIKKRKEFTEAANAWLKRIDQSAIAQKSYADALKVAFEEEADKV